MEDVGKRLTTMPRLWEEARKELGEQFQPVLRAIVDTTSSLLRQFTELGPAAKAMTTAVIPAGVAFGSLASAIGATKLAMAALGVETQKTGKITKAVTADVMTQTSAMSAEFLMMRAKITKEEALMRNLIRAARPLTKKGVQEMFEEAERKAMNKLYTDAGKAMAALSKQTARTRGIIAMETGRIARAFTTVGSVVSTSISGMTREYEKFITAISGFAAANPILTIVGALTTATYLVSAYIAYIANLAREHEEAKKAAGEQAAGIVELQDTMKRLKPPVDDSAASQRMFNAEVERVVSLLPQYKKELDGLATAQEKYSWILSNVPEVGKTALDVIAEMDQKIAEQQQVVAEARERAMRGVGVPGGNTIPSGVKMWEEEMRKLEIMQTEREAVMDSMLAREVRYYSELEKRQTGAYETAMSLEQELATAKRRNADDAISKAIEEYESYRKQLEKTAMTVEQIEKSENAKLEQKKRKLEEATAAKLKEAKSVEMHQAIQNAHSQELALLEKETTAAIEQQVKQREKVIAGMKTALELLKERLAIEGAQIAKR